MYEPREVIYKDDSIIKIKIISTKYGCKECIIDTEDYDKIKEFNWCLQKGYKNKYFYAVAPIYKNKRRTQIRMHRLIIKINKDKCMDHINFNGLDNRKCNLRICSDMENVWHKQISVKNKSGYKGVSWSKTNKNWKSQITFNGKYIYLGGYTDKEKAAKVYNDAAKKYFGEFAFLNQITQKKIEEVL